MTFEEWYKAKNPDLDLNKDEFYEELKEAYETGYCTAWDEATE